MTRIFILWSCIQIDVGLRVEVSLSGLVGCWFCSCRGFLQWMPFRVLNMTLLWNMNIKPYFKYPLHFRYNDLLVNVCNKFLESTLTLVRGLLCKIANHGNTFAYVLTHPHWAGVSRNSDNLPAMKILVDFTGIHSKSRALNHCVENIKPLCREHLFS